MLDWDWLEQAMGRGPYVVARNTQKLLLVTIYLNSLTTEMTTQKDMKNQTGSVYLPLTSTIWRVVDPGGRRGRKSHLSVRQWDFLCVCPLGLAYKVIMGQ